MQLLKKWLNPVQSGVVGLDIGSGAVKLLALRETPSGWTASCAAQADIEPADDKTDRHTAILNAVQLCLSQTRSSSRPLRYAVCGVSGANASVRGFTFPAIPASAVEQAVRFEAQQVCPIDMSHSVLDFQLLHPACDNPEPQTKQSGVLVAAAEQAVAEQCHIVKEAGLKVALMDADGLAALNCLSQLHDLDQYRTVALIDLGWQYINIILLGVNGLPFVRDINTGGHMLVAQVAEKTSRDENDVRQMIWQTPSTPLPDDILVAFHQAARPIVITINETLKFYASQEKNTFAEKVFLCGGGAGVRALIDLISDALPTDVTVFDPFAAIRFNPAATGAELLKNRGPEFVVAAGLAMRTI